MVEVCKSHDKYAHDGDKLWPSAPHHRAQTIPLGTIVVHKVAKEALFVAASFDSRHPRAEHYGLIPNNNFL